MISIFQHLGLLGSFTSRERVVLVGIDPPKYQEEYSFTEVIKQTIVEQDLIFRYQVHELHRLYRVQSFLTKDLSYRELRGYNSLNSGAQLSVLPVAGLSRCESSTSEPRLSLTNKMVSTTLISQGLSESQQSTHYRSHQQPLNLQLSADEFITHIEGNPLKNVKWLNQSKGPMDFVHHISSRKAFDVEEVNLSPCTREVHEWKGNSVRTQIVNVPLLSCQNVIDLEEPVEKVSDGSSKNTCTINRTSPSINSKGDHKPLVSFLNPCVSANVKEDPVNEIAESSYVEGKSECFQELFPRTKGYTNCQNDLQEYNLSAKMRQFTFYQGDQLDLNQAQVDDFSRYSNGPQEHCSVISVGGSGGSIADIEELTCPTPSIEKEANCSNETSEIIQSKSTVNLASMDLDNKNITYICIEIPYDIGKGGGAVNNKVPESVVDYGDLGSCIADHQNNNGGTPISKLRNTPSNDSNSTPITTGEKSSEKGAIHDIVVTSSSHLDEVQERHNSKSPISCESYCISDDDSSSAKSVQSNLQSSVVNQHSLAPLRPKFTDLLSDQHDERTSYLDTNVRKKSFDEKEEPSEVMRRAAESLIQLSSNNPICYQVLCPKAANQETEHEKSNQRQRSYDSFEYIVLNLSEDNLVDDSVSSKPFEVNGVETRDYSSKLRRGRRMKDFQREILPALASLTVNEIHEDMNIMEAILRSRAYRRTRAKMAAHEQNWSMVKRSRQSRLNHVKRRIFA